MAKIKGNPNHPKKGSTIKVDPIRKLKDIKAIKKLLANKPRDLALFTIGINTNLRASDLLRLCSAISKDSELHKGRCVQNDGIGWSKTCTENVFR